MLILTRQLNDKILINDDIVISVLEIDGDKVKIGIDAPIKHKIIRKELLDEVKSSNIEASKASADDINKLKFIINNAKEI